MKVYVGVEFEVEIPESTPENGIQRYIQNNFLPSLPKFEDWIWDSESGVLYEDKIR